MKLTYPAGVLFVVGSRFLERFYYNGFQTIFPLYLVQILNYSPKSSTLYLHVSYMLGSLFPIVAGLMGDSSIGKYRTIVYLTVIYVVGSTIIDVASTPLIETANRSLLTVIGFLAFALGRGCASITMPFGGAQFPSSLQSQRLAQYFSITYISDNISILLAVFIVPILRHNYQCFGEDTCFPLAFTVLQFTLIFSLVVFVVGRSIYVEKKPEKNIVVDVTKCTYYALSKKILLEEKKKHWLDYAEDKYSKTLISDTKAAFRVLFLFLPLPVFWALDDQMAMSMDGSLGWFTIKPDQMQLLDPLLTILLVPLFDLLIYPLLAKCHILERPLQRLTLGGLLAATSFVLAAILELKIQDTHFQLPENGTAQLRVFNGLNCDIKFNNPLAPSDGVIPSLEALQILNVPREGAESYTVSFTTSNDCYLASNYTFSGTVTLKDQQASSLFLHSNQHRIPAVAQISGFDKIDKTGMENPKLRIVYNLVPFVNEVTLSRGQFSKTYSLSNSTFVTSLDSISQTGTFSAKLGDSSISADIQLGPAGIYTFIVYSYDNTSVSFIIDFIHYVNRLVNKSSDTWI